ncbi:predicted protein, partial [Nematostella vectensis]
NTTVRAGETITLTCAVAGNPTPSVSWSKAGAGHSTGGNVFTKAGATKADTGQYVCTAVNTVTGNTQTRTASTYVIPEMVSLTTNTSFWNKKILSLQCKAGGVPLPQITWYKPGGQPITAGVSPISGGSQLQVTTTQDAGDYGQYKCRASNLLGSVELLIYVTQWFAPTFTSSLSSSHDVAENDDVTVMCSASGRPAPNVTWV